MILNWYNLATATSRITNLINAVCEKTSDFSKFFPSFNRSKVLFSNNVDNVILLVEQKTYDFPKFSPIYNFFHCLIEIKIPSRFSRELKLKKCISSLMAFVSTLSKKCFVKHGRNIEKDWQILFYLFCSYHFYLLSLQLLFSCLIIN